MGMFLTDLNCIKQREYVNLPEWNKYTGKGLTIFHDDVDVNHSATCVDIIQTIHPDAKILEGGFEFYINNNKVEECYIRCNGVRTEFDDFIKDNKIDMINNSTDGGKDNSESPIAIYMRAKIKEHNLICTGSSGNYGGMTNKFQGAFIMVGGVYLKGNTVINTFSDGEAKDFAMFMGFQSGTSFSAPFLNGMIGKLRCRYGNITQEEVYKYLKFVSKHFGEDGHNPQYGWGMPVLPELDRKYITMSTNSNEYCVDGNIKTMDTKPVNLNGNVFVPIRAISESLGADVEWEPVSRTVLINDIISLQIGNKEAFVGDKNVILKYAPFIDKNNRTLVPIRFIAEALDCKVDWVQNESKVMILENTINK